jgi:hypothetical protein
VSKVSSVKAELHSVEKISLVAQEGVLCKMIRLADHGTT